MGGVVAGVPVVEGEGCGQVHAAALGVNKATMEVVFRERQEERDPALMERIDELERDLGGQAAIGEVGPGGFVIGVDGGPVFSEREFEADQADAVAVGDVMDELADGPAAFALGGVELGLIEAIDSGAEALREQAQSLDVSGADAGQSAGRGAEAANGKPEVVKISHGWNSSRFESLECEPGPGGGAAVGPGLELKRGGDDGGGDGHDDGDARRRRQGWQRPSGARQLRATSSWVEFSTGAGGAKHRGSGAPKEVRAGGRECAGKAWD